MFGCFVCRIIVRREDFGGNPCRGTSCHVVDEVSGQHLFFLKKHRSNFTLSASVLQLKSTSENYNNCTVVSDVVAT
jgi:hypothetical protein